MNPLPIGTVLELNQHRLLTIGYTSVPGKNKSVPGYWAVPYPIGFLQMEKLLFVPADAALTVIAPGYSNEVSLILRNTFMNQLDLYQNSPDATQTLRQQIKTAKELVEKRSQV